ncbi:MAG: integrase, partial [Bacteroidia bacterium]
NTDSPYAFPRYTSPKGTNGNSASAAINKWLKPRVPEGCVIHSFRHSLRDRLRAVQCPSDMIDQIGGWATAGVGQAYGEGYGLGQIKSNLIKIIQPHKSF